MLTGALVPRWGTVAGVPGPRRSADDRDAGWFAPVATRRRPFYSCLYFWAADCFSEPVHSHFVKPKVNGAYSGSRTAIPSQ
jgi:hypothetical protein